MGLVLSALPRVALLSNTLGYYMQPFQGKRNSKNPPVENDSAPGWGYPPGILILCNPFGVRMGLVLSALPRVALRCPWAIICSPFRARQILKIRQLRITPRVVRGMRSGILILCNPFRVRMGLVLSALPRVALRCPWAIICSPFRARQILKIQLRITPRVVGGMRSGILILCNPFRVRMGWVLSALPRVALRLPWAIYAALSGQERF